ncbi:MAG: hypothetical protein WBA42_22345 [Mesorhizobium sp.]
MSRLIPRTDMRSDELIQCSHQARAILHLVDIAAWSIQNDSSAIDVLSDGIGSATRLALELLPRP